MFMVGVTLLFRTKNAPKPYNPCVLGRADRIRQLGKISSLFFMAPTDALPPITVPQALPIPARATIRKIPIQAKKYAKFPPAMAAAVVCTTVFKESGLIKPPIGSYFFMENGLYAVPGPVNAAFL